MGLNEYEPGTAFAGVIGRTAEESSPAWPRPLRAAEGAPNVLFIVLDDTGFGQLGCYGSPIATPNLDRLAAGGLLYNNMHTTALCSPSRSCIITGRNHHANAMAAINELATGYPGYNGQIPFENGFLSEMLQQHGYNTYMVGKWHLMPSEFESAAGPYDRWPLGRGFERFYGFLGGDTSQWYPDLVYDNHQVEPPRTPEQGYHLTEDLADKAIEFIADAKQVAPHKPFYLHFCPGATHAPHHVPKEWADRYAGPVRRRLGRLPGAGVRPAEGARRHARRRGAVPPRPGRPGVGLAVARRAPAGRPDDGGVRRVPVAHRPSHRPAAGFPRRDRRARQHADHGGLRQRRQRRGRADRDHERGCSSSTTPRSRCEDSISAIDELGGPTTFNHYPWGWTWAGNTPFRRWKRETYRGGACDPFIVHWPKGITGHAVRCAPSTRTSSTWSRPSSTCSGSSRRRRSGASPSHRSTASASPTPSTTRPRRPDTARSTSRCSATARSTTTGGGPCARGRAPRSPRPGKPFGDADHGRDAEPTSTPTAGSSTTSPRTRRRTTTSPTEHRDKLIEMIATWYVEAGKYDVLPIDGSALQRLMTERPQIAEPRDQLHLPAGHPVGAVLRRPAGAQPPAQHHRRRGDPRRRRRRRPALPGLRSRRLVVLHQGQQAALRPQLRRPSDLPRVIARARPRGPARAALRVRAHRRAGHRPTARALPAEPSSTSTARSSAETDLPVTTPIVFNPGGLTCGANPGSPVTPDYKAPFRFTGTLHTVTVDLSGELITDTEAEMRMAMARQ